MGDELGLLRELYRYNAKGRQGYLRKIWNLPEKERFRSRGASFPSVVDIYMHILDAYRFWFVRVYSGEPFEEYPLGTRYTRAQALRETAKVDRLVQGVLKGLRPRDLRRTLAIPESKERIPVRTLLVHMIEEELQHKGELNALLWQLDIDAPIAGFGQ
jgi:uncharacterized damage-inducible protein DinB